MHPVQKHLFDTNFKDLQGTSLSGTLALSDEIINLGLGELLLQLKAGTLTAPSPTAPPTDTSAPAAAPDPKAILEKLNVKTLRYRTEAGRTLLDIEASLD